MISIKEFCRKHSACKEGREWTLANCRDMADVWEKLPDEWLIWVATRDGVLSVPDRVKFTCWCARQVWDLLTDERSRKAVEIAEQYACGVVTIEDVHAATAAAYAAYADVAASADVAAAAAAYAAAYADVAASAAAYAAASAAAYAAADVAAARTAAQKAQAAYLRSQGNPFAVAKE